MYNQYINDRHFRHRLARTHNLMNYFLHDLDAQSSKSNSTNPIRLKRYIKRGRGRGCSNRRIKRRNDSRTNLVDSKNSCPSFNLSEPILICNSCTPPMDNNIHMDTNNVNGQLDLPMNVHSKFPRPTNEITKSLHCSSECLTTLKPSPNSDDLPNLNHLSKHRTVFGLNSEQPWINPESLSTLSNTLLDHSDSGICLTESSNFSSSLSSASSNSTMSITKLNNSNMKHIRPRCNSDSICNKKIMSSLYSLKSTSLSSLFTYNQMGQLGDNLNTTNVAQSAPHDYLPQSSFDEDNSKIEKSVKRRGRNRGCLHKIDFHSKRSYGKWNCFGSVLKHPNWLKPFIRFMAPSEAETFMKSIEREYVLRNELKHLLKSQGIELLDPHESLFKSEEPSEPIPLKSPLFSDEISNANESCPGGVKTRNSTNPQIVNSKLPKSKPTDSNGLYLKRKCTLIHSGSVPNEKTKCHASSKTPKPVCS